MWEMVTRLSMTGEELMCAFLRYGITANSVVSFTQTHAKTLSFLTPPPKYCELYTNSCQDLASFVLSVCIDTLVLC